MQNGCKGAVWCAHYAYMKRTPLIRKTPLRSRSTLKNTKPLKRTAIKQKPKRPRTEQEKGHMGRIAALPCCISDHNCAGHIEVHHITGGKSQNQKNSDFETLPLCQAHHKNGNHGIALHAGVETWEATYGTQAYHLQVTRIVLAKTCPDWCVFTGERLPAPIDQLPLILDIPKGGA